MPLKMNRFKSILLAFCAATALVAQVDSKLATRTDLLDVYKNGGSTPELLTVFDFSGSMQNMFWHKGYWTNLNSDTGNQMIVDVDTGVVSLDIGLSSPATGFLVEPSGVRITTLPITVDVVRRASHARLTATETGSSSATYPRTLDIPIPWTLFQKPSTLPTLPTAGTLPEPDYMYDPKSPSSATAVIFDTVYSLANSNIANIPTPSYTPPPYVLTVSGATFTSRKGVVTITYTTTTNHLLTTGDSVVISGISPSAYNGTFTVSSIVDNESFRVKKTMSTPSAYSSGGAISVTPKTVVGGGTGRIGLFTYNEDYAYWLFFGNTYKALNGNSYETTSNSVIAYAASANRDDNNQVAPGNGIRTSDTSGLSSSGYPAGTATGGGYIIPGVYDPAGASGSTPSTTEWTDKRGTTFNNEIPVGTRCMYLKQAVLSTWLNKQGSVLWAYRFLDNSNEPNRSLQSNNFSSGERVLNRLVTATSGVDASVVKIQQKSPNGSTPLTGALANAYAQMVESATNSSIFDFNHTGLVDSPCSSSFVIIFTDGLANNENIGSGEVAANATTTVHYESNIQSTFSSYTKLNSGNTNYNIWSLAAAAAHGPVHGTNNSSQYTTGTGLPSDYAPFRVMTRGASGSGRKITTMTVGLSLAGTNTSSISTGGKGPLIRTALYGDPNVTTFDLANSVSGSSLVAPTGSGIKTNFFDATDPASLTGALKDIIARITQANTSIVAPAAPLVGLNLGNRVYLGRFASVNASKSSVWQGDLLMAGLGIQIDGTVGLKDKGGEFQTDINASNAVASASAALATLGWKNRKIYTAVPGTTTLVPFTDTNTGTLTAKVMGVATLAEAQSLIRFVRGASLEAQVNGALTTNRDDIMGDIINSSPAAVEYDPALISSAGSTVLSNFWAAHSGEPTARFQVIFVGDNQGHFHAFGEVSYIDTSGVLHAAMDELWSFIPSELLNNPSVTTTVPKLSKLKAIGNDHIYTMDGSPYIYFKDNPASGSSLGNRRVGSTDVIRVIVGMRKGGRSYYAFNVVNPGSPLLAWVLDPNTSTDPTIKTMGLATSSLAVARVETSGSTVPTDVLILGGGYSDDNLDNPPLTSNPMSGTPLQVGIGNNPGVVKLGRSLLALNVLNGNPVKYYDFVNNYNLATAFPNMGAISAGGFPFEFFLGSKKAQRVYFGDLSGGVYALGSMKTLTTAPVGWRMDSSNIDEWTTDGNSNISPIPGSAGIRWIYKGATTVSGSKVTAASPISSIPVAYRIPTAIPEFRRPANSTNAPNMIPPVVGVTFGTGDRNDPMDAGTIKPVSANPLRQVMVFDRQDSADLPGGTLPSDVNTALGAITDAQLSDRTGTTTPGTTSYLGSNQYLGYYLKFHTTADAAAPTTHTFFEKSYLNAAVVNGALLFSTFKPGRTGSATICEGAGNTLTFRMCDALAPVFNYGEVAVTDTLADKLVAGCNGSIFTWTNLAGDLTTIGSRMVLQSGQDTPVTGAGAASSNVKIQDLIVKSGTQAFAPRAWRIVR